ncbi:restriction endonuclease [Leptospira langatensis]|uniref:Restriction endonuclease n=1 Tax=Leptospira langatensis TaxID=2484983 RepID=A0A5F1ZS79_9LEPT|nr:restriction endonuclease [Leptospira langatensis]TGK00323.1 restriction endonuclease [Leptospira langatensis]TGL41040.1 restriction endonuclease [Leptospira langatensis]
MSIPTYDNLLNPALQAFHNLGGSASIDELEEEVAKLLNLSDADLNELMKNQSRSRFNYRLAWARNYLKNYGLLENTARGIWALTQEGRETKQVDRLTVVQKVKEKFRIKEDFESNSEIDELEPEENISWQDELLNLLKQMKSDAFERLCQRILRESGFVNVEITGRSGDGGIDGRGVVRLGGLLSFHVYFQCKRYKDVVGPSVVRDFRGAMSGRADKGLIITTGRFTSEAKREALRDGAIPLDLIDGQELVTKLKELRLGVFVKERMVEDVVVEKDWFIGL